MGNPRIAGTADRPIPPGHEHTGDASRLAGQHVIVVVADHDRTVRPGAGVAQRGEHMPRIGFSDRIGIATADGDEACREAQGLKHPARRLGWLVGAHGHAPAGRGKRMQSLGNAWIGVGGYRRMPPVIGQEGIECQRIEALAARQQGLLHQRLGAMAHHRHDFGQREGRKAARRHQPVEGGLEIRRAVHERTVEVEQGNRAHVTRYGDARRLASVEPETPPVMRRNGS